jgi:N-acetylneuraminic acid mutarotase
MHVARGNLGAASVNNRIYAIGGATKNGNSAQLSGLTGTNEEYNPASNTWTLKAPMPTPRACFATAVYQNKIYCIGGFTGYSSDGSGYLFTRINEMYDIATNTWETKTPMPTARGSLQANVVGDKIYLVGGRPNGELNEVYDPANDSWVTKEPMPNIVFDYASAVVGNKIYFMGGTAVSDWSVSNLNQIYDPAEDKWSLGAPSPTGVVSAAAKATTGKNALIRIYLLGMQSDFGPLTPCLNQVYDPKNNNWTLGSSLPNTRRDLAVAVVNDLLYAIGGHIDDYPYPDYSYQIVTESALTEQYTPFGYGSSDPSYLPSPMPSPSLTFTSSPTSSPSPTATATPNPPSSPASSQNPPTSSPEPQPESQLQFVVIAALTVAVVGVAVSVVVLQRRRRKV